MIGTVREAIHKLDPRVEVWANLPMTDHIKAAFLGQALAARLLTGLSAVALILAAMGIYGVMAYVVSQRTHEIGIRMALGAQIRDVLQLIVGHGMTLGAIGVGAGLAGAFALTRLLSSFLYGVSPFDAKTFFSTSAILFLAALLASLIPACRAARGSSPGGASRRMKACARSELVNHRHARPAESAHRGQLGRGGDSETVLRTNRMGSSWPA